MDSTGTTPKKVKLTLKGDECKFQHPELVYEDFMLSQKDITIAQLLKEALKQISFKPIEGRISVDMEIDLDEYLQPSE